MEDEIRRVVEDVAVAVVPVVPGAASCAERMSQLQLTAIKLLLGSPSSRHMSFCRVAFSLYPPKRYIWLMCKTGEHKKQP